MKGSIPSLRFGFQCCVHENSAYLFGGNASMDGIHFNDLYQMDLTTFEWFYMD